MRNLASLTLFLIPFISTAAMSMVNPSYCHTGHSTCTHVCQAWNKTWTGEVDGHVCCHAKGKACLMWGCFCE